MNLNKEEAKLIDELLQSISSDKSKSFRVIQDDYSNIEYAQIKNCAQYIKENKLAKELRFYKVTSLILAIIVALITILQFFKK